MIITYWKGIFVADNDDEKGALRKAGFEIHEPTTCNLQQKRCKACSAGVGRRYWSDSIESATRLKEFCNERALKIMREHLLRLEKSRAVDSDLAIPCPSGLAYLGYQKGGIAYASQRKDTLIGDDMGLGKYQSVNSNVLTPSGWRKIGELKPGDEVIGSNGKATKVEAVYPQGIKPLYRVSFDDGSSTLAGLPHLWKVRASGPGWNETLTLSTLQLLERPEIPVQNGDRTWGLDLRRASIEIPLLSSPVEFETDETLPLAPYMTGLLADNLDLPPKFFKNGEQRRIPGSYLRATISERIELLRGLLDAEGNISPANTVISYTPKHISLSADMCELVEGLGGVAVVKGLGKVEIHLPGSIRPFWNVKKTSRYDHSIQDAPSRRLTSVEYYGDEEAVCIKVASEDHLYVTDNCILTHNTVQALGFVNYVKPKNVIVVAPKTLIWNWRNEATKWLVDDYQIVPVTGKKMELPKRDGLFVITNYEKIYGQSPFAKSLARIWDVAIFDECQAIKNPDTERSKAVLGDTGLMRRAHRTLFLTGTPIENYPKEIWPIAAAISPAKFGDFWDFAQRYCGLHQEHHTRKTKDGKSYVKSVWVTTGATRLGELQQRLRATFMVRRLKNDVLKELPPKRRQLILLQDSNVDWSVHPQFKRWKELYEKEYEEKLARLEAATTRAEYRDAALALENFTGVAFEEMSAFRHQTALAKLPLCLDYLDELLASGVGKVVVFAHHEDVLLTLEKHFGKERSSLVYGKTSDKGRERAVKEFQDGDKEIFIAQLRVGGVGLNLTAASTVVFVEIDWVPGVLSQCEDRLCRIGQKKMVHVIHLLLGNTLDANMARRIVEKQEVIDRALDLMPEITLKMKKTG